MGVMQDNMQVFSFMVAHQNYIEKFSRWSLRRAEAECVFEDKINDMRMGSGLRGVGEAIPPLTKEGPL